MNRHQRRHSAPLLETLATDVRLGTYSSRSIANARKRANRNELPLVVKFVLDHPNPVQRVPYSHKLKTRRMKDQFILGHSFPKKFTELDVGTSFGPLDFAAEVIWAVSYFIEHFADLNTFLSHSTNFNDSYLTDNLRGAEQDLDFIEGTFGLSLWLVKNRIALLQATAGLDAQKQYSASVRQACTNRSLVTVITHYISMRNEPSVTPARFYSEFQSFLRAMGVEEDSISAFLKYHITPSPANSSHILQILEWTNTGSIIDYYESFIYCLQCAQMNGSNLAEREVYNSLDMLTKQIQDPRISMVLALAGASCKVPTPAESILVLSDLSVSNGIGGHEGQRKMHSVASPDLYLDVFNTQRGGNGSEVYDTPNRLTQKFKSFLKKDVSSADTNASLTKEAINFYGSSWSFIVLSLLEEETLPTPLLPEGGHSHFAAVAVPNLHPLAAIKMPPSVQQKRYANLAIERLGSRPCTVYAALISGATMSDVKHVFSSDSNLLLEGKKSYLDRAYDKSFLFGTELYKSPSMYFQRKGVRLASSSLLKTGQFNECAELIITTVLAERGWQDNLPIEDLANALEALPAEAREHNLANIILFELYSRYFNNKFDSELPFSLADFLDAQGVERPSALDTVAF